MKLLRPIIRTIISGDKKRGDRYRRRAEKQYSRELALNGDLLIWKGQRVKIASGVHVQCSRAGIVRTIHIMIDPLPGRKRPGYVLKCFCNECFAMGQVISSELTDDSCRSYTVAICQEKLCDEDDLYIEFQNVMSSSYAYYEDRQPVIVGMIDLDRDDGNYCPCDVTSADKTMCKITEGEFYIMIIPVFAAAMTKFITEEAC